MAEVSGISWTSHTFNPWMGCTMDMKWADDLLETCRAAGIAYYFQQIDKVIPVPAEYQIHEFPAGIKEVYRGNKQ